MRLAPSSDARRIKNNTPLCLTRTRLRLTATSFTRSMIRTICCIASRWWAGFALGALHRKQAFTFSLATVHTDPDETNTELDVLDDVFFKIRDDPRRGEDDVILAGDFNAKAVHLRQLGQVKGLAKIIHGETPTNTLLYRAIRQHLVSMRKPRASSPGVAACFDFVREYRLTPEQAQRISDHLPVWAEFSVYEGGGLPLAARTDGPVFQRR